MTGSPVVPWFGMPPRVDILKLPGWTRDEHGDRRAGGLALDVSGLHAVRSGIELAVATSFDADVAVVDKLPLGPGGELTEALEALRGLPRCRVVLGLRDIDDAPDQVRRAWGPDMRAAIERYYDAILVYGPASSPDAIRSVGWTDLTVPVHHVGYLGWPMTDEPAPDLPDGYLLATVGGGHDGYRVLEEVLQAIRLEPLGCPTLVITGPLMPKAQIQALRSLAAGTDAQVVEFRGDMDRVLAGARAVVGMAGYNTVAETLRARRPALLVPRARPSQEQLVRARVVSQQPSYADAPSRRPRPEGDARGAGAAARRAAPRRAARRVRGRGHLGAAVVGARRRAAGPPPRAAPGRAGAVAVARTRLTAAVARFSGAVRDAHEDGCGIPPSPWRELAVTGCRCPDTVPCSRPPGPEDPCTETTLDAARMWRSPSRGSRSLA